MAMTASIGASAKTISLAISTRGGSRGTDSSAGGLGWGLNTATSIVTGVSPDAPLATSSFEVLGHGPVLARLADAARRDQLTHAILFTGPDQVGKTTTAVALAIDLLRAQSWPGGARAHPDLWLEDSDNQNIHIGRVRVGGSEGPTLQDFLALRPYAGGRRVAVMGRADRLTEQAADSLLKTIEEPPPATHLLLCAAHPERLPQTILSRCELVSLSPVSAAAISDWLLAQGVADDVTGVAAALAAGRPGRGLRLATEPGALGAEVDALNVFIRAGGAGTQGALKAAAGFAFSQNWEGRERALVVLAAWASFVRDALCFAAGTPELAVWTMYREALESWAEALSLERLVEILALVMAATDAVSINAQPRLAFEALLLDVFAGPDSPPLVESLPGAAAASGGGAAGRAPRRRGARRE
jgi:DNA polymerase III subunit delta'